MKPTAEQVKRAHALGWEIRDCNPAAEHAIGKIAQALADEHERAMESAARIADHYAMPSDPQMQGGPVTYRNPLGVKCAAAIRAAAKGAP